MKCLWLVWHEVSSRPRDSPETFRLHRQTRLASRRRIPNRPLASWIYTKGKQLPNILVKCSEQFTRIGQLFPFNINILFSLLLFSVAIAVFICFLDRRIKLVLTGFRPRFPGLVKHTRGAAYNIQLVAHYWWTRRHISLRSMFDQGHWWGERAGMADYITTSFIWIITRDKILRKYTSSLTEPVLRRPSSSERQLTRPTETQWSGSQWNDDEEITVINNW